MLKSGQVHFFVGQVVEVNADETLKVSIFGVTPQVDAGLPGTEPALEAIDGVRFVTPPGQRGGYAEKMTVLVMHWQEGWDPVDAYLVLGCIGSENAHTDANGDRTLLAHPGGKVVSADATKVHLGSTTATKGVARKTDAVTSMPADDATFWALIGALAGAWNAAAVAGGPLLVPQGPALAVPNTLASKITGGSDVVFADD